MLSKVWIPHDTRVYELAEFISENVETGEITVLSIEDKILRTLQKLASTPADASHLHDVDDLCAMNNLHEAPLLQMLKSRYFVNNIYTYIGNILISLNPYVVVPGLYDNMLSFIDIAEDEDDSVSIPTMKHKPHVFVIANNALRALMLAEEVANQSLIISGESGAGLKLYATAPLNVPISNNFIYLKQVKLKLQSMP